MKRLLALVLVIPLAGSLAQASRLDLDGEQGGQDARAARAHPVRVAQASRLPLGGGQGGQDGSARARAAETEIDRALRAISSTEARFVHRFRQKGAGSEMVERGTVLFGTLPSMRWEYDAPEQKTFVFDGISSYFYVPEARQVTVTELTEEQRAALPFLFLADPAIRERNFRRREKVSQGLATIRLEPRSKESTIREVVLTSTVADHVLRKVEYTDRLGNKTIFELSNVVKKDLPDGTFRFTPPTGVQVIRNE